MFNANAHLCTINKIKTQMNLIYVSELQGSQHVGKGLHTTAVADKNVCYAPQDMNYTVSILTVWY